ncbi:MAG: VWA domain-containing protein, partial [bacterium]|nr:VWA domain-containing protein [bacterium]
IDLYHNDTKIELPPEYAHIDLEAGNNPFVLKLPIHSSGPQRFRAIFVPDDPDEDTIVDNNRADAFSFVSGRGKVLVVSGNPSHDQRLIEALRSENVTVHIQKATQGEMDLLAMLEYSSIILANVPADTFTDEQQQSLARYVRDMGGGLIMTGGDESFGAGGWIGTPIEDIMPVSFEIKHKRVIPRGALVLIMHSCEIPRGNFWGKEVAKKSVDTISSRDYIGVLAYSWSSTGESWEVRLQLATNKAAIKGAIDQMAIGDMPDFDATMQLALKGLQETDAAQKHIIMISDGDPSPPAGSLLRQFKAARITISTIGIGYGSHVMDASLRKIAKVTGGRFYACKNPRLLPQIFVKESKVVRRPLIIDEPFQPQVLFADSDVLPGVFSTQDVPPLGGLVLTSPKSDSRVQMPLIRATKDGKDPVLAHWQEGLGKAVVFTSGYWPKWGTRWTQWARFSKLWAQIVRWSMRQEAPANFETFTRVEGDNGRIVVEALDEQGRYLDGLNLTTKVIQPNLTDLPVQFTQTGPGHYEAVFPLDQTGQYIANVGVHETDPNTGRTVSRGLIHTGVSVPFSPEFRELRTNEALLRQVADVADGRWLAMDPASDEVFSHDLPPTVARRPAWDWTLAWLLLPLFLLDVAVRRLASWLAFSICVEAVIVVFMLWGLDLIHGTVMGVLGVLVLAEVIGWSIRWRSIRPAIESLTHTVTALGHTGDRTSVALEQLKGTKDRVRDDKTAEGRGDVVRSDAPAPDRRARFDAGEPTKGADVGDLHEQLGGAKVEPGFVEKRRAPAPGESKDGDDQAEDVTSRLLKAKRRAQKDKEE